MDLNIRDYFDDFVPDNIMDRLTILWARGWSPGTISNNDLPHTIFTQFAQICGE